MNRVIPAILMMILLSGCGSGSERGSIFVPASGHPADWAGFLTIGTANFHGTVITSVPLPVSEGATPFRLHCAVCHDGDGRGKIGPDITQATLQSIHAALAAVPLMQGHAQTLREDDIQNIAAHLAYLREGAAPVRGEINPDPCTECHGLLLDGGIAGISCFSCHNGPDGGVGHRDPEEWLFLIDDPVKHHAPYGEKYGEACRVCHGFNLTGGVGPSCSACHDGIIVPRL